MALPTRQAVGAFVDATDGGAMNPAWPAHAAGDIGLLIVETCSHSWKPTDLAGFKETPWSPQRDGETNNSATSVLLVYWKRATGAAEPSPTLNAPAGAGLHARAVIVTIRGCGTVGVPWDVGNGDAADAVSSVVTMKPITTTEADALVVNIVTNSIDSLSAGTSAWANAALANIVEWVDSQSVIGSGSGLAIVTGEKAAAGAVGSTTGTLSATSRQGRIVIAFTDNDHEADTSPYRGNIGTMVDVAPGTVSPAWPTHVAGDIGILIAAGGSAPVLSDAQGFVEATPAIMAGSGASGIGLGVWWKRATTAAEPAPTIAQATDNTRAIIITIKGVTPDGDPINAIASAFTTAADVNVSMPAVTTTTRDCGTLSIIANSNDIISSNQVRGWDKGSLDGVAEIFDENTAIVSGGGIAVGLGWKADPGGTGTVTALLAASSQQAKVTLALEGLSGETLDAETGVFNMSGQAATFLHSQRIAADTGAFVLTGEAAEFPVSIHENVQAETGVFTCVGGEAIFRNRLVGWSREVPSNDSVWTKEPPLS